jgi:hypothetical protein
VGSTGFGASRYCLGNRPGDSRLPSTRRHVHSRADRTVE